MPDYPQVDPNPDTFATWGDPAWMVLAPDADWTPSNNTNGGSQGMILRANFGDGYSQIARDGFNQVLHTIQVDVSPIEREIAADIYAFLSAQLTYGKPFYYTPVLPLPTTKVLWTSEKFGFTFAGNTIRGITAEFKYFPLP